jgi:hypothetical protein
MTWEIEILDGGIIAVVSDDRTMVAELETVSRDLITPSAVVIVVQPPGIGLGVGDGGAGERWWFPCPTVLAAEGDLCDGAMGLVAACDVTVMAIEAQLVDTQTPGLNPAARLLGRLPHREVARMGLLGRLGPLAASRAAQLGCVDEVVDLEAVRPRALVRARVLSGSPPLF